MHASTRCSPPQRQSSSRSISQQRDRDMRFHARSLVWLLPVLFTSGACASGASSEADPSTPAATHAPVASPPSNEDMEGFPIQRFADISEERVSDEQAVEFQAILDDMAGKGGMTATVMSRDGTWSGATGTADGVRDVRVDDQFFIASITKSVVAAQVLQMVEAGE